MAIAQFQAPSGMMGSKAGKAAMGYVTGGPAGAAMSLVGGGSENPMGRRLGMTQTDPKQAIMMGLDALWHPDVPPEVRAAVAPSLLQAKHFGFGSGG